LDVLDSLLKTTPPKMMPDTSQKAIMLGTDVIFATDISALWKISNLGYKQMQSNL
jgi:lipopolysaccharide biosynthesis glycosyltransferase